jgi:hypothetical protein
MGMNDDDIPFSWRNWFTLKCALRKCVFMADPMGAHCKTNYCNARVQIYFDQLDQWRAITKRDELATKEEFEIIASRLITRVK